MSVVYVRAPIHRPALTLGFPDIGIMHYRTPSTISRNTNGSTMRRRSGGSMSYKNLVHNESS